MKSIKSKLLATGLLMSVMVLFFQCNGPESQGSWIKGNSEEKLHQIEWHFRGFDMAMVEVGYRYQELYWAGMGMNWDYAQYQLEKIELTMKNGFERRPLREASGRNFIDESIPEMLKIIKQRDTSLFKKEFLLFTAQCNHCHIKEALPFFRVEVPQTRNSIIR